MYDYGERCKKAYDDCLIELFKRVGLEYPNEEFTNQPEWYSKRTWTKEEETDFSNWMKKLLKKRFKHWSKNNFDMEVGMFLLNYGWRVSDKKTEKTS